MKVLIIDDEMAIREVLQGSLADEGYQVKSARSGAEGLSEIEGFKPDVVLLDIWMPGDIDGIEVLRRAQPEAKGTEFIMMSGHGTIETAVKAVKLGAWDFVEKPISIDRILILLQNIKELQHERVEKNVLLSRLRNSLAMIGSSQKMIELKQQVARLSETNSWVLISGEEGSGRSLTAQNIHYMSSNAGSPIVEFNCKAVPEDLLDAEIFGFAAGAFVGHDKERKGKIDFALNGTLILEEVSALSLPVQIKILKLLQDKTFERFGSDKKNSANVRVIATTQKNLSKEVLDGKFSSDLFQRLSSVLCLVSPLRERRSDIKILIEHFSQLICRQSGYTSKGFSQQAVEALTSYSWPGNVRELFNFVERLYILSPGESIEMSDLKFAGLPTNQVGDKEDLEIANFREARASFEKEYLLKKLSENKGNISKTAEAIGLERSYLHRKIKSFGIDVEDV